MEKKTELERAIYGYLVSRGYSETASALCREAQIEDTGKANDLLEVKWRSILRLQRRVMELETDQPEPINIRSEASWCARGPALSVMKGHRAAITCVSSLEADTLITGSEDGTMKLWDMNRHTVLSTLTNHVDTIHCLAAFGNVLISGSADRTARVWDLSGPKPKVERTLRGHDDAVLSLCLLQGGDSQKHFCATACKDGVVRIFDLKSNKAALGAIQILLNPLGTPDTWPRALAANDCGLAVIFGNSDTCLVYSLFSAKTPSKVVNDQKPLCTLRSRQNTTQFQAVAFGPSRNDESQVATGGRDGCIYIWNLKTQLLARLDAHTAWVRHLAWHPSGRRLISCSDDRSIATWDLQKARLVHRIDAAHSDFVSGITFHAPTAILASVGADKAVRLWDSPSSPLVATDGDSAPS